MANRHLSRSIVLQTLFEWDFMNESDNTEVQNPREILVRNIDEFAPDLKNDPFVFALIENILVKQKVIDEIIEKAAPEWPIQKISVVDRNIIRIGLTELLFGDDLQVPPKVAINESIELAKTFGGENSSKFVNGVLGAVYKEMGEPRKEEKSKSREKDNKEVDITTLPVENYGGALIYTKNAPIDEESNSKEQIMFALVHDVFGYWTLSKGSVKADEDVQAGTIREIKDETGLDITIKEKLGENQYVANHPEKGKILKKVTYFLAESDYKELELQTSGGLDEARWFRISEIANLRFYNDIVPLVTSALEIISKK
ncbi:MAG: transcription antitermination factor NusB [Candidatus Pacebacteria bacterium]|nr:transcription antitermination factor NusB [Candidatus Paceibacterota bacterium]MCF7862952.1 transcription antitermination factor NusB [Candidatus Paceibacterota bacterium]